MIDNQITEKQYRVIYQTRGISPVQMLNIIALSFAVAGMGLVAFVTKAPPPILFTDASRVTWAVGIGLFAVACPLASWLYSRRIASRILLSSDGRTVRVFEMGLFGSQRDIKVSDVFVESTAFGDAAGERSVSPTRLKVAVRNQRNFVVPLNRGMQGQRDSLLRALS